MGWRDFQEAPPQEFMEFMESMNLSPPLIPFIPLIPIEAVFKNGGGSPLPTPKTPDTVSAFCESYGGHCSGRLPKNKYPAECLQIGCEYYQDR